MLDKIWYKHYPSGVPRTINEEAFTSLASMMEYAYKTFPNNTAMTSMGAHITYAELDTLSQHFAAFLQHKLQLKPGARVALMMPNILQFPIAMLGILRAGMTVVNVNPLYTSRELVHQLNDSGADAIVVLTNFAATLEKALPDVKLKHVIVSDLGDCIGGLKGLLVNTVVKHVKRLVPKWNIPKAIGFKQVMHQGAACTFDRVDVKPDDVAFLQYTGGTTGVSKGAVLLHRNMLANVLQIVSWVQPVASLGNEAVIVALPLYHIFSLTVCCFCFFSFGAECILVANPRDIDGFVNLLTKSRFSFFVGLNTLFNAICDHDKVDDIDFSKLRLTVSGGMALQSAVAKKWHEKTGLPIVEGYGLTEASPVLTINPVTIDHFNHSVGVPIPSTDVIVRDKDGKELPIGREGELCARGPQVMKGYWNRPEATAEVIDDQGWLRTGDIARIDERGFVYLVDRQKDMVVVSGFNVYPNEVEEVISTMPGIREVAVIGVPSERTGEAVKAFVVKSDQNITEADVRTFCRDKLTPYKIPKKVEFRFDLPKSNVGKILRRELRQN
jgi:long-chain acyl-CoA synthetase